jgi:uncharacterized damage-inducible protein DinB
MQQPEDGPMFMIHNQQTRYEDALDDWREASDLVSARWQTFVAADPDGRSFAFAAYTAALDAEEAAALTMATVVPRAAA